MELVSCGSCNNFLPDPVGFGDGIGKCSSLEIYKQKIKDLQARKYNDALSSAEARLGIIPLKAKEPIRLLYPNAERVCEKFQKH